MKYLKGFINLANDNAGFVSVILFVTSILFAWFTGIFRSLIKKPKFKISVLPGPTQCSTFPSEGQHNGYELHRTAISLYLNVSNIGSAPASIDKMWVGYHWNLKPFSWLWLRYKCFWFWLKEVTTITEDFQYRLGNDVKIYPSLFQITTTFNLKPDAYLEVGKTINGVVYFEQDDSWGGCSPRVNNGNTKLRLLVFDSFGKRHKKTIYIPYVTLEEAKKYNPAFGSTRGKIKESYKNT